MLWKYICSISKQYNTPLFFSTKLLVSSAHKQWHIQDLAKGGGQRGANPFVHHANRLYTEKNQRGDIWPNCFP